MTEIRYIGKHQPNNIIDVNEETAERLVKSKQYMYIKDGNSNTNKGTKGDSEVSKKNKQSKTSTA